MPPCASHEICGLRDKHPELKQRITDLQKQLKQIQQELAEADSKAKSVSRVPPEILHFFFRSNAP
jgi:predicted  nucleic acid-binding Zn-ribbon protein